MSTSCPDCRAPLTGTSRCPSCGLPLHGPLAVRLWTVDQQLAALSAERLDLLGRLRLGTAPAAPAPRWTAPAAHRPEAAPRSAQNTLLGLGALLLAAAVLVFAAVTYSQLGAGGRALALLLLTVAAGSGATALARRGLASSAEAVAVVTLVLAVSDAWAVRRAGLAPTVEPVTYAAAASGVLAALAAGWAAVTPLRVAQAAAVGLAQGLVVLELAAHSGSAARVGAVLAVLTAADALAARLPLPVAARRTAAGFGALWACGTLAAAAGSFADAEPNGSVGPVVLAAVAAWLAWDGVVLAASAVPVLGAAAAFVASRPALTAEQRPLVLAAVALASLPVCALVRRRVEPVVGALAVAALGVLAEAVGVLEALFGPLTWLAGDAWSFHGTAARDAVAAGVHWDGTVVTVVVVAAAAVAVGVAGLLLDRTADAVLPAGLLLGVAAVCLPLGLATGFRAAIAVQLLLAGVLCAAGLRWGRLLPGAVSVAAIATAWSLAQQDTTLVALAVSAVLAGALAVRWAALTGLPLALAGAELLAAGAAHGLPPEQLGGLLLPAVAVCTALSFTVTSVRRAGCEGAAVLLGAVSVLLASGDLGWLSWSLAGTGLLVLAVAARPDRRAVGYAGALLLAGSSWVRLADAHVHAPEPYVVPLAVMTLVLGHLRRRAHPGMGSFEAYGAALSLGLLPSLVTSLADPVPFRALLVLLAGTTVVLVGASERLRAPLALGGSVVAVEALHLLAPYAAALPRWLVLAAAGAALVGVGATYEQRLRDVSRLRRRFDSFA